MERFYIPIPPIPPAGIPGAASFSSGLSATIASVVTNNPAKEKGITVEELEKELKKKS